MELSRHADTPGTPRDGRRVRGIWTDEVTPEGSVIYERALNVCFAAYVSQRHRCSGPTGGVFSSTSVTTGIFAQGWE
jgi:hypothetical protein